MPGHGNRDHSESNGNPEIVLKSRYDGDAINAKSESVAGDGRCFCAEERSSGTCELADVQNYQGPDNGNDLENFYHMQGSYDDDDDDSDWEPEEHQVTLKWFCVNCTMPNFDGIPHCNVCGEHKDSEILLRGCFASRFGPQSQDFAELDITVECQENVEISTAIGFDERMLLHAEVDMKSHPHPERPDRLRAIAASLSTAGIFPGKCHLIPAREITEEELHRVHASDHIEAVKSTSHFMASYFTPDTYANEHSALAARLAAGSCSDLAVAIMNGEAKNGFALVRPPGHHASVKQAMGFCLHNNAAVAAKAAESAGARRILIVDWDVHHGNGTQEIFEGCKTVLYVSLHRHENGRFYPGTGAANEVGILEGKGYSVNIPWPTGGIGDNDYIFAFQHIVLPIANEFSPDLTIISAGFDAARGDPLGCCDVTPSGYACMTHMLSSLCQKKMLVILEGGYNLRSISSSATAVIKVLIGETPVEKVGSIVPSKMGLQAVLEVLKIQSEYWTSLKSAFDDVHSKWGSILFKRNALLFPKNRGKKARRMFGPVWWKWTSKSLAYRLLYGERKKIQKKIHHHCRR